MKQRLVVKLWTFLVCVKLAMNLKYGLKCNFRGH